MVRKNMAKFFMVIGVIIMVLSGGCSLLFLGDLNSPYVDIGTVAVIGGVPFAVGLIVFLLAKASQGKTKQ